MTPVGHQMSAGAIRFISGSEYIVPKASTFGERGLCRSFLFQGFCMALFTSDDLWQLAWPFALLHCRGRWVGLTFDRSQVDVSLCYRHLCLYTFNSSSCSVWAGRTLHGKRRFWDGSHAISVYGRVHLDRGVVGFAWDSGDRLQLLSPARWSCVSP